MARTLAETMSDDLSNVFMNTDEFAQTVTHTNRDSSTFDVSAVWTPSVSGVRVEDDAGRRIPLTGQLIVAPKTSTGADTVIDDQGAFTIEGLVYQVVNCIAVGGGFSVEVKRTSQKLMKKVGR